MSLLGPVVEPGPRRRPAEPQIVGSNPTRPATLTLNFCRFEGLRGCLESNRELLHCLQSPETSHYDEIQLALSYLSFKGWSSGRGLAQFKRRLFIQRPQLQQCSP